MLAVVKVFPKTFHKVNNFFLKNICHIEISIYKMKWEKPKRIFF